MVFAGDANLKLSKRTGAMVFKITEYAQRLLDDLQELSNWPEKVKLMQENWIGKSKGIEINFCIGR